MVKHIDQLTDEIIDSWKTQFNKGKDGYYCKTCGSPIMQTTCHVSIHTKLFPNICAGSGEVQQLNYPFCQSCDGKLEYVTACYHV